MLWQQTLQLEVVSVKTHVCLSSNLFIRMSLGNQNLLSLLTWCSQKYRSISFIYLFITSDLTFLSNHFMQSFFFIIFFLELEFIKVFIYLFIYFIFCQMRVLNNFFLFFPCLYSLYKIQCPVSVPYMDMPAAVTILTVVAIHTQEGAWLSSQLSQRLPSQERKVVRRESDLFIYNLIKYGKGKHRKIQNPVISLYNHIYFHEKSSF